MMISPTRFSLKLYCNRGIIIWRKKNAPLDGIFLSYFPFFNGIKPAFPRITSGYIERKYMNKYIIHIEITFHRIQISSSAVERYRIHHYNGAKFNDSEMRITIRRFVQTDRFPIYLDIRIETESSIKKITCNSLSRYLVYIYQLCMNNKSHHVPSFPFKHHNAVIHSSHRCSR